MHMRREGSAGPALVLIHAFPYDGRIWNDQLTKLGRSCRVLAPDLPGFGRSPAPAGTPELSDFAGLIVKALAGLGIERAVVAGCSVGGRIALAIWRCAPRLASALAFVNSRVSADGEERRRSRYAMIERVEKEGVGVVVSGPPPVSPLTLRTRPEVVAQLTEMAKGSTSAGVVALLGAMARWPEPGEELSRIDVPTSVIHGVDDPILAREEAEAVARAIPGATFVPIAHAGHIPSVEQPDAVNAALRDLLSRTRE